MLKLVLPWKPVRRYFAPFPSPAYTPGVGYINGFSDVKWQRYTIAKYRLSLNKGASF